MCQDDKPGGSDNADDAVPLKESQPPGVARSPKDMAEMGAARCSRALAGDLAEDVARALFLNIKKLPKRQKNWALTYDAYLGLAQVVVALLQLSGWRFDRKPRRSPRDAG